MKTCYFTATGNSLYTAKRIGGELRSIPRLMKQDRIVLTDESIRIVCPVYGGEMPRMVRQFIEKAVFTIQLHAAEIRFVQRLFTGPRQRV